MEQEPHYNYNYTDSPEKASYGDVQQKGGKNDQETMEFLGILINDYPYNRLVENAAKIIRQHKDPIERAKKVNAYIERMKGIAYSDTGSTTWEQEFDGLTDFWKNFQNPQQYYAKQNVSQKK